MINIQIIIWLAVSSHTLIIPQIAYALDSAFGRGGKAGLAILEAMLEDDAQDGVVEVDQHVRESRHG